MSEYSLRQQAAGRGTPAAMRPVLNDMHELGWTAKPRGRNRGYWAVSPDGGTRTYVPITTKDSGEESAKQARRVFDKWKHEVATSVVEIVAAQQEVAERNTAAGWAEPVCGVCGAKFNDWLAVSDHMAEHDEAPQESPEEEVATPVDDPFEGFDFSAVSIEAGGSTGAQQGTIDETDGSPTVATTSNNISRKRGGDNTRHNDWQRIRGGLARDLYDAMRARGQAGMSLSTYANALAQDIEQKRLDEGRTGFDDGSTLLGLVQALVNQVEVEEGSAARVEALEAELAEEQAKVEEITGKYTALLEKITSVLKE